MGSSGLVTNNNNHKNVRKLGKQKITLGRLDHFCTAFLCSKYKVDIPSVVYAS